MHIPTLSPSICRMSPKRNITQGSSSRLRKSLFTCLETRMYQGKVKQTEKRERTSVLRVGSARSVRIGIHPGSVPRLPESAHYAASPGLPSRLQLLRNFDRHLSLLHLDRRLDQSLAHRTPSLVRRAPSSIILPFLSVRYARRGSRTQPPAPL